MEGVFWWLNHPLFQDSFLRIWMVIGAGAGLVLAMILILVLIRKRKKKKEGSDAKGPVTEKPVPLPVLELANLQGLGEREEQQDAFGISRMERVEEDGLLAVLCDGMGGMAQGGMIARGNGGGDGQPVSLGRRRRRPGMGAAAKQPGLSAVSRTWRHHAGGRAT